MRTVYKYSLSPALSNMPIEMPKGARVLYVAVQDGEPHVWAEVDTDASVERVSFVVYGTGHEITGWAEYVGSFMLHGGRFVFHVWKRTN